MIKPDDIPVGPCNVWIVTYQTNIHFYDYYHACKRTEKNFICDRIIKVISGEPVTIYLENRRSIKCNQVLAADVSFDVYMKLKSISCQHGNEYLEILHRHNHEMNSMRQRHKQEVMQLLEQ